MLAEGNGGRVGETRIGQPPYKVAASRPPNVDETVLTDPMKRLVKALPNNLDIIKRAFI